MALLFIWTSIYAGFKVKSDESNLEVNSQKSGEVNDEIID